jgi:hypothetical protein
MNNKTYGVFMFDVDVTARAVPSNAVEVSRS